MTSELDQEKLKLIQAIKSGDEKAIDKYSDSVIMSGRKVRAFRKKTSV
jgi:hypothetical protein